MRGHFKKVCFDLYLRESRSRRPNFRSGSEGHLEGSYGSYKLQIPQLTKKRAMIFKIVDGRRTDDDGRRTHRHLKVSPSVTSSTGETKMYTIMGIQCWIIILYMVELGSTLTHVRNRVKLWSATSGDKRGRGHTRACAFSPSVRCTTAHPSCVKK